MHWFLTAAVCSLLLVVIDASCSAGTYTGPYDLSLTPATITIETSNGNYYIRPCGSVSEDLCPNTLDQQQCFAPNGGSSNPRSDALGTASSSIWTGNGVDDDWSTGAISQNTDIWSDIDQCNATASTNNYFQVVYHCVLGTDTGIALEQPSSTSEPCQFLIQIDSSVVCEYQRCSDSSSTGSPVPPVESSSDGLNGGEIFAIILLVFVVLYLGIGIVYKRARGFRGIEQIPNYGFWNGLMKSIGSGMIWTWRSLTACVRGQKKPLANKAVNNSYTSYSTYDSETEIY